MDWFYANAAIGIKFKNIQPTIRRRVLVLLADRLFQYLNFYLTRLGCQPFFGNKLTCNRI